MNKDYPRSTKESYEGPGSSCKCNKLVQWLQSKCRISPTHRSQAHIRRWLRGGYLHFQKSPSEYLCHPSIQYMCVFPLVPTLDFQLSHFDLVFFQKKRNPRLSKQTKVFGIIQDQQLNGSTDLLNKSKNEPWCTGVSKIREK